MADRHPRRDAFGHLPKMLTLPLGLEADLDVDAGTFSIGEAAVV